MAAAGLDGGQKPQGRALLAAYDPTCTALTLSPLSLQGRPKAFIRVGEPSRPGPILGITCLAGQPGGRGERRRVSPGAG